MATNNKKTYSGTYSGRWKSKVYPNINGLFTLTIGSDSDPEPIKSELKLVYNVNSKYKPGKEINIQFEGFFKSDEWYDRYMFRQPNLKHEQYFTMTISNGPVRQSPFGLVGQKVLRGFVSCIFPQDCVQLSNFKKE